MLLIERVSPDTPIENPIIVTTEDYCASYIVLLELLELLTPSSSNQTSNEHGTGTIRGSPPNLNQH
jgi:hypothetical protein